MLIKLIANTIFFSFYFLGTYERVICLKIKNIFVKYILILTNKPI